MALAAGTIYECNASATASNVNGGGFNPANSNFLTDGTVDTNTGNTGSPVFSSASYNFAAGDVGAWLFVKSGTNTIPGYYQIASVASNKATLTASIGSSNIVDTSLGFPTPFWKPNTAAGISTVGTPTSITFGIDYSRGTSAIKTNTDLACTAGSTTITATTGFTPVMVGNIVHLTALTGTGAIVGWYELVSYTNATTVVLDRTPTNGVNNITAGTFYVGGAMSLNSTLDDDLFELGGAGTRFFIKNGSYTLGESVGVTTGTGSATNPCVLEGYNSIRGDAPTSANMPYIVAAAFTFTFGSNVDIYYINITGTVDGVLKFGNNSKAVGNKAICTSTNADRSAILTNPGTDGFAFKNECISYRGRALATTSTVNEALIGNYCHDSNVGIGLLNTSGAVFVSQNISANNVTAAIHVTAAAVGNTIISSNTLYGSEAKIGSGLLLTTGTTDVRLINNIFRGFATGVNAPDTQTVGYDDFNSYSNNTADVSASGQWQKGVNCVTTNPAFTSVSQVTGTAGKFAAGNDRLIDTTKNFTSLGVVGAAKPVNFINIISGTGSTPGIYGITSVATTTNPNDTLVLDIAPGTNTTTDKAYSIPVNNNFMPTGSI